MNAASKGRLRGLLLACLYTLGALGILSSGGDGGGGGDDLSSILDTTAPTVSSGPQVNAARNQVVAIFSEAMDGATINASTFTVMDNIGTPVAGGISYSGVTATFTPAVQLASGASFDAMVTTGAHDLAGNALASDFSWSFTTTLGNIQISWDGNLETAVNRPGGGYKVYYSANSGFNPGDGGVIEIDVPYSSGVSAPTSIVLPLDPGIYYIRVAAYSALNPPGTVSGSTSTATPQITLTAP